MTCHLDGWSRPRRMAVIERHRPAREPPAKLPLFELLQGRYEVVVTNLQLNAESLWRLYNRGTVVEQVIEEVFLYGEHGGCCRSPFKSGELPGAMVAHIAESTPESSERDWMHYIGCPISCSWAARSG